MSSKGYELVQLAKSLTVDASGTITDLNIDTTNIDSLVNINLAIAPEVLEIQVDAPDMGQDTMWKWTWEQSTLPYARRTITNSNELNVPLYKEGTYAVNNYAAYDIHDSMTQTHSLYLKWVDGAGSDNLISWATSSGPISDTHPDINGGNATDVQRITVNVPSTVTPPTLTNPSVSYTVVNNGSGGYTFSGAAKGDNPNLGPFYRGGTYTVNINATGHPFYFTTDNGTNFAAGTYFGEYTSGVTGSRTDSGTITFTVPANAPDTLYYQCGNHSVMRGEIVVKDLAVETNINGNYVVYFQHTQEGHRTAVELRPIPSLVNQMCIVYDANSGKFVPQDLATYVENTPSFENKIREVAGTAELVVEDGSAVVAKVNVYDDSTYLPLSGNNPGDQAFATDTDILYIWDGSAWQQAGAANSDDLTEGTTNLFFTDARADARISAATTTDLTEGSNLYYTDARADARITAATTTDLTEGSNLYYTDTRVGTYISGDRTYGNITTTGYIAGPATMTIDPAGVGDITGKVVIAGDLQVDGTTTTINSTTLTVDDKNIVLASGSADAATANGAGITVDGANATITYDGTNDEWNFNKPIDVSTVTVNTLVAGTANAERYLLDAVAKDISDTAVDVFVYDTRKDSDGGAWRKRTQHTSWYNETLNTATRGSRKEFPAVAVIVAESNQVTIYDGDDPDMPMWMVFNAVGSGLVANGNIIARQQSRDITSIAALNGQLSVTGDFTTDIRLLHDNAKTYTANLYTYEGNIEQRNDSLGYPTYISGGGIVNNQSNDVAMTVLPNAPIDAATGLPVPTIAVATDGGVSVINDDGTVADSAEANTCTNVLFDLDGNLYRELGNHYQIVYNSVGSYKTDSFSRTGLWTDDAVYDATNSTFEVLAYGKYKLLSSTNQGGFYKTELSAPRTVTSAPSSLSSKYLVNRTTSDYNTGWMNGDIKLATLSDTNTGSANAELVTNGDGSTTTGWTAYNSTLSSSSGAINVADVGDQPKSKAYQAITTVAGKIYTVTADVTAIGGWDAYLSVGSNNPETWDWGNTTGPITTSSPATLSATFTADSTTMYVQLGSSSTYTASFQNISVQLADVVDDRSVNGNSLQVFGTVTKSPVATGADLVGYSGFSTTGAKTNYLHQPYNSDLDFDTSFCFMGWVKVNAAVGTQDQHFFDLSPTTGSGRVNIFWEHASSAFQFVPGNGAGYVTAQALGYGEWHHVVCLANTSSTQIYIDGTLSDTGSGGFNHSLAADAYLTIGTRFAPYSNSAYGLNGSLALIRLSKSIPSPEQIKKIYNDEKFLFQENAKATLYGSSDAVTALAYDDDTELLHVGTSAGRSVFRGLRRIDNTTDAVGAAISASNGMVAED